MASDKNMIRVEVTIAAPVAKVWQLWTSPGHITRWNFAAPEWHAPHAENNLAPGGRFKYTMAARDGSMSFDFEGTYTKVDEQKLISYKIDDGRTVEVAFEAEGDTTRVTELFEPESQNPHEMQQGGWQAILNNFKAYVEGSSEV